MAEHAVASALQAAAPALGTHETALEVTHGPAN
jgi:hypothetical protein